MNKIVESLAFVILCLASCGKAEISRVETTKSRKLRQRNAKAGTNSDQLEQQISHQEELIRWKFQESRIAIARRKEVQIETSNAENNRSEENDSRIFGGTIAVEGRYPYMAALFHSQGPYKMDHPFCGGVLISPTIVLTAAHCIDVFDTVILGLQDLSNWGLPGLNYEAHFVPDSSAVPLGSPSSNAGESLVQKVLYPFFERSTLNGDFALILLQEASVYQPISLNMDDMVPHVGTLMTTMGWGFSDLESAYNTGMSLPTNLLETNVEALSEHECKAAYEQLNYDILVRENVICALTPNNDPCQGDSGGPLILKGADPSKDVLLGTVSWGYGCANNYPGVYARVSSISKWLVGYLPP